MSNSLQNKTPIIMKMRNKGKVYPSSSSSPSPFSPPGDSLSVLNLLPAAILGLAVVLSLEDREVLAYMITRSIKSTKPLSCDNRKKTLNTHKPPLFDCDCFDCYTSYWFKWDSSPNRELIHHAIEAFEESLSSGERSKKKGKKKEKIGHRCLAGNTHGRHPPEVQVVQVLPEYDVVEGKDEEESGVEVQNGTLNNAAVEEQPPETAVAAAAASHQHSQQHKGLARKVLPDVIGLFNWRLWSLWSPNV